RSINYKNFYTCLVASLVNKNNNTVITGYSGTHLLYKNDTNVTAIYVKDTNTKYIPRNLGLLFNLTKLTMLNTQLVEIKSQDFIGMVDLKVLNLFKNNLTSIPTDAFSTLTELRDLSLSYNQIEEISNEVFVNNLQLQSINLDHNRIKFIGSTLFDRLTKLNI
ncbi:unnamed protein product, partial [Diamesa serratosioi]